MNMVIGNIKLLASNRDIYIYFKNYILLVMLFEKTSDNTIFYDLYRWQYDRYNDPSGELDLSCVHDNDRVVACTICGVDDI